MFFRLVAGRAGFWPPRVITAQAGCGSETKPKAEYNPGWTNRCYHRRLREDNTNCVRWVCATSPACGATMIRSIRLRSHHFAKLMIVDFDQIRGLPKRLASTARCGLHAWSGGTCSQPAAEGWRLVILNPRHGRQRNNATLRRKCVTLFLGHRRIGSRSSRRISRAKRSRAI